MKDLKGRHIENSRRRRMAMTALAAAAVLLAAGAAAAYWEQEKETINLLTMGSYQVEIEELYEVPESVEPSQKIEKRVHIKNSGTVDTLVRVSVEKMFGTVEDGVFVRDPALDGNMIEIAYHTDCWQQGNDGWFYYREILKAGETTREPLMDSCILSPQAGNEYQGKEGRIVVHMESVQADADAAEIWGIRTEELGIVWPQAPGSKITAVEYRGKKDGFSITAQNTDLFAAFKNLTPGCARSQAIAVKNSSLEDVELFLRAEEMPQEDQNAELVQRLLSDYAQIEVRCGARLLYSGPVRGEGEHTSMKNAVSLGTFPAGTEKRLSVRLALAPETDNQFQTLTAKVKWVFLARGEDKETVRGDVPITGDSTNVLHWSTLMAAGAAAIGMALVSAKKKPEQESMRRKESPQAGRTARFGRRGF